MELRSGRRLMPLENTGASCGPPQPKRRRQDPNEKVCRLCQRADADPMVVGELCRQDRLSVHENCLYHASGLTQRGADDEGFYGFLLPDIQQEIKRGGNEGESWGGTCPHRASIFLPSKRPISVEMGDLERTDVFICGPVSPARWPLMHGRVVLGETGSPRCCFCHQPGASVTCRGRLHRSSGWSHRRRCSRTFHFPCGREGECISQFFGEYKSFCSKHRPVQRLRGMQQHRTPCLFCLEPVSEQPCFDTLVCPACASAWLHRSCIQAMALSSGLHLFRCPHCRDTEQFLPEMLRLGIKIPNREASWELEIFEDFGPGQPERPGTLAFQDFEDHQPWKLLLCSYCGSRVTHQFCATLGEDANSWECSDHSDTGTGYLP
ncbi:PHD finger protein 7-like [Apus apus]|uniref:PHD finger protein 7-like n=1 Tax=Apus apus TaxID=8895 RepID=UPI0021F861BA|nr:PHD finger protein 7-like [Apus apus]